MVRRTQCQLSHPHPAPCAAGQPPTADAAHDTNGQTQTNAATATYTANASATQSYATPTTAVSTAARQLPSPTMYRQGAGSSSTAATPSDRQTVAPCASHVTTGTPDSSKATANASKHHDQTPANATNITLTTSPQVTGMIGQCSNRNSKTEKKPRTSVRMRQRSLLATNPQVTAMFERFQQTPTLSEHSFDAAVYI